MAKYQVLRPFEFRRKLYVPADLDVRTHTCAPGLPIRTHSFGNGQLIPVDQTGEINLPDDVVGQMQNGQIGLLGRSNARPLAAAVRPRSNDATIPATEAGASALRGAGLPMTVVSATADN